MNKNQNKLEMVTALTLSGLLALGSTVHAQTTNPVPSAVVSTAPKANHGAMGPLQMMKRSLNLTDEQVQKLEPIFKEHQDKITALRRDTSLSHGDKAAKMREVQAEIKTKINTVLTPEQADKWEKRTQVFAARPQPQQAQGQPVSAK